MDIIPCSYEYFVKAVYRSCMNGLEVNQVFHARNQEEDLK